MIDQITGLLRALFKTDKHVTENKVFTLHHRVNFFVILVGIVSLFASNLTGNAITCRAGSDFDKTYCFLHGGRKVEDWLLPEDQRHCAQTNTEKKLVTNYYIWLPYVLIICAGIVKAPHFIWKTMGERGIVGSNVELKETPEKMAERFKKLKGRRSTNFCLSFLFCQFLSLMSVIALFLILDKLLDGNFWSYGSGHINFLQGDTKDNPICNVFPTEISCDVRSGGATQAPDIDNTLCILSNNMFNQYYFLILWFWWTFLLIISGITFLIDLIKCIVPAFSNLIFHYKMVPYNLENVAERLKRHLSPNDTYLLTRITQNLKGSEIEALLRELHKILNNTQEDAELETLRVDEKGVLD